MWTLAFWVPPSNSSNTEHGQSLPVVPEGRSCPLRLRLRAQVPWKGAQRHWPWGPERNMGPGNKSGKFQRERRVGEKSRWLLRLFLRELAQ